jgi:hypothetical protein
MIRMSYILNKYQDRKLLKWMGFYLSEHTSTIEKEKTERSFVWSQKPQMTTEEIRSLLEQARLTGRTVIVQLEEMNQEGLYPPDVSGPILGYDELGIFIGNQKVHYDEIRHVAIDQFKKWSDLS